MVKAKSLLCIGGPYSGQRVELVNGDRFYVPAPARAHVEGNACFGLSRSLNSVAYVEQRVRTPDGEASFFVPEGQSALDTMTMLLEAYERLSALMAKGLVDPVHVGEGSDG